MSEEQDEQKPAKKKTSRTKKQASRLVRDADGLIEGVEYKFDDDGFINWRAMVSKDMVYPNREWFLKNDKPVPDESDPNWFKGLDDNQLLIRLGGLKKLLRLRGFTSVGGYAENIREGYCHSAVTINFMPNFETNGEAIEYTEVANATEENTDGFGAKFLEAFAYNRAFARCIRNFLNINIVSSEELDRSNGKPKESNEGTSTAGFSPQDSLQNKATEKGYNTWPKFVQRLRELWQDGSYKNEAAAKWQSFKDIPAKDARVLIGLL